MLANLVTFSEKSAHVAPQPKNQGILKRPAIMQGKYPLTTKGFLWKVSTLSSTGAWSIVPPLLALGLALITKEVYSSLTIGVLMAW